MLNVKMENAIDALMKGEINLLAHGVNCSGGFGSGVAGELSNRLPIVKEGYLHRFNNQGWQLGAIQEVTLKTPVKCRVLNCATQQNYGRDGAKYTDEAKVSDVLSRVAGQYCSPGDRLGFPFIGTGLGGADKDSVFAELITIFNSSLYGHIDATLYLLDRADYDKYSVLADDHNLILDKFNEITQEINL